MMFRDFRSSFRHGAAAFLMLACASVVSAQSAQKNPTSKLYVADSTGESQIDTGDKIQPIAKNAVYSPEGSVIETKAKATDALVLSNGTALYVTPETRFEVKKFVQEPFTPNRTDLDLEPSISQTVIHLSRGALGICTSKLVAGSTMTYRTPEGSISVRGRRLLIETMENQTRVSLLEGDITIVPDGSDNAVTLEPGQQAILRRTSPDKIPTVVVQPIPDSERPQLDDTLALACIARRTVSFESVENPAGGTDIVPVPTAPLQPQTEFTVSPARIDG